jgi:hypothetical protein
MMFVQSGRFGGGALAIFGTPVVTTIEDVPYAGFTVSATGGTAPYTFSVHAGTLPTGITLNSSTGLVSGTPTTPGTSTGIVIRVTDNVSATADLAPFDLEVQADSASVTYVAHGETVNDATPNYTGLNFGDANADRVLVAFEVYKDGAAGSDFAGTTIGGISAAEATESAASGPLNAAIHVASVPAGTSGDIDITVSSAGATLDSAISLLRMKGFSATPYAVNQGLTGGTSISRTINCPAGGVIVAGAIRLGLQASPGRTSTNSTISCGTPTSAA